MKYKITKFWKGIKKESYIGNKSDVKLEVDWIGTLYSKVVIEEVKERKTK